jgi:hypothetical protein
MDNIVHLDLDFLEDNVAIYNKLMRTINYFNKHFEKDSKGGDVYGYFFDNSSIDQVYIDGTGKVPTAELFETKKNYIDFRPGFTIKDGRFIIYNVPYNPHNHFQHVVIPEYNPIAWVICGKHSYHNKRCDLSPFPPDTARYVEEQFLAGHKNITYNLLIDGKGVEYKLIPDRGGNPELFVQQRSNNKNIWRYVMRIPNKEARELLIKDEIKDEISEISPQGKLLIDTLLIRPIDLTYFDKLYIKGDYESEKYDILMQQKNIFESEYGYLTRDDVYYMMQYYNALKGEIAIDIQ